jgi:arylsulfatase A-like enzyme
MENGEVTDELGRRAILSFNREVSGDVYFQAKPYYFPKETGSNHGQPYNYDSHVPLIWYGVGVKPGVYPERAYVMDLAPTLSRILGIPAPPRAEGRVLF